MPVGPLLPASMTAAIVLSRVRAVVVRGVESEGVPEAADG